MAEKSLWAYLKKGMKGKWAHATRHEDMVGLGVSDVSYYHLGNSWIELKEVKELPKRETTGIGLGQWHKNGGMQRHFLIKRKGFLLVRINKPKRKYFLFKHYRLPPWERPYWTIDDFINNAAFIWNNRIDFDYLGEMLEVQQETSE